MPNRPRSMGPPEYRPITDVPVMDYYMYLEYDYWFVSYVSDLPLGMTYSTSPSVSPSCLHCSHGYDFRMYSSGKYLHSDG